MRDSESKPESFSRLWLRAKQREGRSGSLDKVRNDSPQPSLSDYDGLFSRAAGRLRALRGRLHLEPGEALRLADLLIAAEGLASAQSILVDEPLGQNPAVVLALLQRSKEITPLHPDEGIRRASLALKVAWLFHLDPRHDCSSPAVFQDLRARAAGHTGNALRLMCRYAEAEDQFQRALEVVAKGTGDPLAEAEIRHFHGSLLRDRRYLAEARRALRRAAFLYGEAGQRHEVGKVLFNQALTEREAGDPSKAARLQRKALGHLNAAVEPQLQAAGFSNLALFLAEAGQVAEAQRLLAENPLTPGTADRFAQHRIWIEGVVAALGRDWELASELLHRARQAFAELEDGHLFATATVDLAAVYAEMGDFAAARELAAQSLKVLQTLDVSRDAIAAFLLFHQAVATEVVSAASLRRIRLGLEDQRLWRNHHPPS